MRKPSIQVALAGIAMALMLTACGGGGGATAEQQPGIGQSVSVALQFITNLIAGSSDSTEPIDLSGVVVAVDDVTEPAALSP